MRTNFVERRGKLQDLDRSFDLKFWQSQTPKVRFDATWELIVHAMKVKGRDVRQLRLQRSVTNFQRQPRFNELKVFFISKEDLIAAKRASARPQDLIDADLLSKSENG